ncbi:MAG: hypothetical protein J07AB43_14260 [Candidatus Nanosalina sp. J07AB43]|nr:MAG: hypothetical protein J07AB43_14260 [Candidatus Nanosalina sp. J07AB43]
MTEYSGPFQPLDKEHGMYVGWIDDIDSGMDGRLYVDADILTAYVPEGHVAEVPKDIPVDVVPNNDSNNGITTSLEVTEELSGDGRYLVMGTPESGMNQSVDPVYHNLINKFFEEDVTVRNRKPESKPLINNTAPLNKVEDIDRFLDGGAS